MHLRCWKEAEGWLTDSEIEYARRQLCLLPCGESQFCAESKQDRVPSHDGRRPHRRIGVHPVRESAKCEDTFTFTGSRPFVCSSSYSVVTLEMKKANLVFKLGKQYRLSRPGSPRCLFTGTVKRSHIATRAACLLWTFARGDESVCLVLLVNVLLLCLVVWCDRLRRSE